MQSHSGSCIQSEHILPWSLRCGCWGILSTNPQYPPFCSTSALNQLRESSWRLKHHLYFWERPGPHQPTGCESHIGHMACQALCRLHFSSTLYPQLHVTREGVWVMPLPLCPVQPAHCKQWSCLIGTFSQTCERSLSYLGKRHPMGNSAPLKS